jgi:hypothetical protein
MFGLFIPGVILSMIGGVLFILAAIYYLEHFDSLQEWETTGCSGCVIGAEGSKSTANTLLGIGAFPASIGAVMLIVNSFYKSKRENVIRT